VHEGFAQESVIDSKRYPDLAARLFGRSENRSERKSEKETDERS